jgi:hypothetical protein
MPSCLCKLTRCIESPGNQPQGKKAKNKSHGVFTKPTLSLLLRSISKFGCLSCIMSEKAGTLPILRGESVHRSRVCARVNILIQPVFVPAVAVRVLTTFIGINFTFFVTCLTRVRSGAVLFGQTLA